MKTLNIMGMDWTYKAALRGYDSAILTRAWNGIGTLEIVINSGIPNANKIQQDDILWFDTDYHKAHIVEKIEVTQDGSERLYKITAAHISVLLRDFITLPPAGQDYDIRTGSREDVARAWVTENAISPADPGRVQYPIVLGAIQGIGSTITEQTRMKVLAEELRRIFEPEDLGWGLELDIPNQQYIFRVYAGVDRTSTQSENSRILFGIQYGNLAGYRKVVDRSAAKTVAYVGGQGEGAARSIVEIDAQTPGARRREAFVDARDVETTDELIERGLQTLSDLAPVDSYEFEALNRQFTYETDYDLGDFVTIVMDKDSYQHLQIKEITEIYVQGNITVVPAFGKTERTIAGAFQAVTRKVEALEGASLKLDDESITPKATWSSEKIRDNMRVLPPIATVVATAAINIPAGWLECNGQAVSRDTCADLFDAIGTTYGEGNGTSTFNVPDLKGRIPVGQDAAQTEFDVLGETGGEKAVTLTEAQLPSHTHGQRIINSGTAGTAGAQGASAANNATAGATVAAGSGQAHPNLQPYIVLRYIIKY